MQKIIITKLVSGLRANNPRSFRLPQSRATTYSSATGGDSSWKLTLISAHWPAGWPADASFSKSRNCPLAEVAKN